MVGTTKDPSDGKAVAGSVFAAVVVYAVCGTDGHALEISLMDGSLQVFLVFCGFQAFLHVRQSKRGAIELR